MRANKIKNLILAVIILWLCNQAWGTWDTWGSFAVGCIYITMILNELDRRIGGARCKR